MDSKRGKVDYRAMNFNPIKQWKETPPGVEQKEMNRMFQNNLIDEFDTPNNVREKNSLFSEFSPRVFAAHFRKTKAKYGLCASSTRNVRDITKTIPELGSENKQMRKANSSPHNFAEINFETKVEYVNPPVVTWMYTDHVKMCDFVHVVVPVITGSTDFDFTISEDGMKVSVNYSWPETTYKPCELFKDEINDIDDKKKITMDHPKIHALTSYLIENGITEKSNPRGNIMIELPVQVQRDVGTWQKKAIKREDGTKIILLELKGFQKNRLIEDADTTISFRYSNKII